MIATGCGIERGDGGARLHRHDDDALADEIADFDDVGRALER